MMQSRRYGPNWRTSFLVRFVARSAANAWRWSGDRTRLIRQLGRWSAHLGLGLMLACLAVVGGYRLKSAPAMVQVLKLDGVGGMGQAVDAAVADNATGMDSPYYQSLSRSGIIRQAQAHTAIPQRPRLEVITYTVQVGDTAESIAQAFGLQPTTLIWSNPEIEKLPDLLKVGQVLVILPIDGVYHTVEPGDTLESLAEAYKVSVAGIRECPFNDIPEDGTLEPGTHVVVPGGTKPYIERRVTLYTGPVASTVEATGRFRWPTVGILTQGYWYGHRAIDIGAPVGTAVRASDGGFVSFAGWTDVGYGYLVVIDHSNGYQTYYAHLSDIFVREGEVVDAGQVIGAVGSTGNSTGPHLHFEIRFNRYPTNPLIYLP